MAAAADRRMRLELKDGLVYDGFSFGAETSIAGELVFQTGMVGYPESITDPSYRGQILVITFPLIGNYGVPSRQARDKFLNNLPLHFEAEEIHIKGLIVASYCGDEYSHYLAESSLGAWLKEQNVPAMYGIDTRALTKYLRERGSTLGRLLIDAPLPTGVAQEAGSSHGFKQVDWYDPNVDNLVAAVSCPKIQEFHAQTSTSLRHPSGRALRVVCVDVGLKHNQIRCLVNRGVDVLRVPFDFDFHTLARSEYDGLFISNGPGDPAMMVKTVTHIRMALQEARTPIFGICLGHQLMALAAGARTSKMKFGNRGHNIPCTNLLSGRCYITSQNHGFQVDASTLPDRWEPLFQNANDGSNEGIRNVDHPFFSVQFHPESTPGPRDTEFLFDIFIDAIAKSVLDPATLQLPVHFPGLTKAENDLKFPRVHARKVLVLGSGGLSIGQAGEFDYSGSQAIKALKEEGIYTVLINPNIATIQTSKGLADKVYFLPVTADSVRKVIKHERPDAIYVTFGGQTALQVGIQLKDEFESLGVKVLGTPINTIITTEDRELFARSMESIGEKCAKSASANTTEEAVAAAKDIGYPVIIRAAYALGGLGSGFADNEQELLELCGKAFAASPQVLVERSMKGWKEIEYEVVRDARDNCITVCNMENFDPLGIHTGDSIVVAPSQTLSDEDYNMLRTTAVNVIRHLGVVGECNIQYALNPFSKEYCIIEVNARLSRSSALASKATGYPLAFVAAKLGLNIPLDQIRNSVTQSTCACFEPSLDYVVVKIPRWDLKKFTRVSTALNSAMKSVGEVMSIGRSFEEAIQKAIRAIDYSNLGFNDTNALMSIDAELQTPSDQRLFAIANAMHSGYTVDKIWEMTKIDKWFLSKLKRLSNFAKTMTNYNEKTIPIDLLKQAKQLGFSDKQLAKFWSISNEETVRQLRLAHGICPVVKQIDTVAAEFPAMTNYLYLTYNGTQHDVQFNDNGVMVLGSGVYRIGSSVEFDWCSVRTIRTLRAEGFKTVMINYNPETVSTDYDEADRLYFENITLETVRDIYDLEHSYGAIISMGGQTPNNIAMDLFRRGVKILGTSPEMIDSAEDRYKFSRMLDRIFVDQPAWKKLTSVDEAAAFCDAVTYPVLVRPSYVLSGAAMNTVYSQHDLANFLGQAADVSPIHPVVITKYIENAKEIEMDAVALDGQLVQHFISEHVENAGVHSGDATLILPPQDLEQKTIKRIEEATRKIANALNITGPLNIQFIAKDNEIKVIECNVRASRSFPFVSKVMGIDLIEMATKAIMGLPVVPYPSAQIPADYVGVKVPQFSFSRLSGADPVLGVEMASTGEVACFGRDKYEAYLKAFISTGFKMPKKNILFSIGSYKEKMEMLPSIIKLHQMGYSLFATTGTADFLQEHGVPVKILENLSNGTADQKEEYSLTQHLGNNLIDLCIVLPSSNRFRRPANYISTGYRTRRMAVDYQVPLVTNVKNAKILIEAIARLIDLDEVLPIDYQTSHRIITLPGLINVAAFVPGLTAPNNQDLSEYTKASTAAGFSMVRVLPLGAENMLTDPRTLKLAQSNAKTGAYCDYNLSVAANGNNVEQAGQILSSVASLYIPMQQTSGSALTALDISHHFESWPKNRVIVTDAKNNGLAAILLQASLENRKLHVTNVTTAEDINMIAKCKRKGLEVTCDVSVYALFLSQADMPGCTFLPTAKDQKVLWEKLNIIDVFSIGPIPYQLASVHKQASVATVGIADALPLLLTAVHDGRLKVEDITSRMHDMPKKIFELHDQDGTTLEIELDRPYAVATDAAWSPFSHRTLRGAVKRVNFMGRTIWMDGILIQDVPQGKDMSSHTLSIFSPVIPAKEQPQTPLVEPVSAFQQRKQSIFTSPLPARRQETAPLDLGPVLQDPQSLHLSAPGRGANLSAQVQQYLHNSPFKGKHVVSVKDVSRQALHILFTVAQELALEVERRRPIDILAGRILGTLFYEPSTRTSASFDAAMQRVGGGTIPISTAHSSVQKGETLQDTIRTLACYCDAIVMRHPDHNAPHTAVKYSPVPIINGGNGSVEHPTQAFLDLYTIREELGTVNGLTITFVGDLKYGRTVHSVVKLLAHYDVKVQLVSPVALSLPADVQASLVSSGQLTAVSESLTPQIIAASDVLYCTRVQKERFEDVSEYERLKDALVVNNKTLKFAKQRMIVMHPLPRNMEVAEEIDSDLRARYFKQMQHGMHCRMALLALILA